MMHNVLVLCDHASPPPTLQTDQFDLLYINQYAPGQNLRLEISNISHRLLKSLNDVARDLMDIAAFVYYADNSIRRGTDKDVFNKQWVRTFAFVAPVRRLDVWRRQSVRATLIEMLEFLTEDRFEFIFTQRGAIAEQLVFREIGDALPYHPEADCVMLFSGGMDSLAGAVHLQADGRRPILVSHRSRPPLSSLQRKLARSIRQRFPSWEFPHLDIWINRKGRGAVENSQRSRSFLFLALGSLVAYELGMNELVVCENGITTFNLPRLGQTTGTLASRSTHPRFIHLFHQLVSEVFGVDFNIKTPFLWMTRGEVMGILKQNSCADFLPLSASCNQSRRPTIHPHCGTCSQCVDRRFAVMYTGLDILEDELNGYEKDIFTDGLDEGQERTQAWSIVQFALDVRQRDMDSFCEHYVEVFDAIDSLPGDAEQILQAIYKLHCRFADEVRDVMAKEHGKNWERIYNHELSDTCLLMLTGPAAPRRSDPIIAQRAEELIQELRECPVSESKPLEDLCEEVLIFLFCEDLPRERALDNPVPQSATDQRYEIRDLVFRNRATEGFWAEVKNLYDGEGIVVDAKNYGSKEIDSNVVHGFSKYLKEYGLGRLGIIAAREVPPQTQAPASMNNRLASAIEAQKSQWRDLPRRMIILLGEEDLVQMLKMKASGQDPTDLLSDRIFTLKSRM
jgi:7-cyano-7-deazaguanine synthase in queuosine biosynthesis